MIGLALVDIIALWIMIIFMLVRFYKIKPLAAYLNIPYHCCPLKPEFISKISVTI
jgi:tryptophan-rich sensory protein